MNPNMLVLDRMALCYSYTSDYRFNIHENQAKLIYFLEEVEPSLDTAALMNRHEVLWPELGLRLHLGLPDSPRRFFCLLPQSVYLAPSSLEIEWGKQAEVSACRIPSFMFLFDIHTSTVPGVSKSETLYFTLERLTLQASAGAGRHGCTEAYRKEGILGSKCPSNSSSLTCPFTPLPRVSDAIDL